LDFMSKWSSARRPPISLPFHHCCWCLETAAPPTCDASRCPPPSNSWQCLPCTVICWRHTHFPPCNSQCHFGCEGHSPGLWTWYWPFNQLPQNNVSPFGHQWGRRPWTCFHLWRKYFFLSPDLFRPPSLSPQALCFWLPARHCCLWSQFIWMVRFPT
jgi:hypothetical protein